MTLPQRLNLVVLLLVCLAQSTIAQSDFDSSIVAPPDGSDCFSNTTDIFDHLVDAAPFSTNTYVLCPDTVYNIGFTDSQGSCCEDGDLPLMAKTNTKFQCGQDGSSKNNCTLVGGTMQLLITPLTFGETEATNVIIQGITFTKAGLTTTAPALAGDYTFVDCIFEVRMNVERERKSSLNGGENEVRSYSDALVDTLALIIPPSF
jgi:hypothetical protein